MAPGSVRSLVRAVFAFLCAGFVPLCSAGIHRLAIRDDSRSLITLEGFGFASRGRLEIGVSEVSWSETGDVTEESLALMGFCLAAEGEWAQLMEQTDEQANFCPLQGRNDTLFTFDQLSAEKEYNSTFSAPGAGRYIVVFANCLSSSMQVSMALRISMYNLEGKNGAKDYLSVGTTQLPILYGTFFLLYLVLAGLWVYACAKQKATVHSIHILMGVLLLLKALYLFSEAEDKAYVKRTGTPHGWDIAFYAFSLLRGVMLFTVIALIGTGWSFVKPYLQDKDKKLLMIVIPLQVLENIATVITGETGPFWKNWFTWSQLLLLIDVICCFAILFPIVWSIRHLRQGSKKPSEAYAVSAVLYGTSDLHLLHPHSCACH